MFIETKKRKDCSKKVVLNSEETRSIGRAVQTLEDGGSVVYPTDTVLGLGVDALNPNAVKKLLQIKERNQKPISVLFSNLLTASKYVIFPDSVGDLLYIYKILPGNFTVILPLKREVPDSIRILSGNSECLGVRIANDPVSAKILEWFGKPITTTNANIKGGIPSCNVSEIEKQFEKKNYKPDFYLKTSYKGSGKPSHVISICERGNIKVIRA